MVRLWNFFVRFIILLLVCLSFDYNCFAFENVQVSKVARVYDGDTIELKLKKNTSIRLIGVDCYETAKINRAYKQAYIKNIPIEEVVRRGLLAKKELNKIIKSNHYKVFFKCEGIDDYGRLLGEIYTLDGKSINEIMKNSYYCYPFEY